MSALERKQIIKRQKYFRHRAFSKGNLTQKIVTWVIFSLFLIYAISLLYPFFYLVVNSFKPANEFLGSYDPVTDTRTPGNYFWFTLHPTLSNFITAFNKLSVGANQTNIFLMFLNSVLLSVGETLVSMALTCMAAYVLAKYQFKGSKIIYTIVLISSFIPTVASLPATYKLMNDLSLMGTYFGMIVLNASAFGGAFLYIHSYFKSIPWSFAESAMIDGAGDFRIFRQIMIPLARNGVLTFTVIRFLGFWNDYWYPSLFYSNHPTLAVGIAGINNNTNAFPVICAAMVLAIVPVLIFYAIFQKKLMINTIDGGLK